MTSQRGYSDEIIYRYGLETDQGHKVAWATSPTEAALKVAKRGLVVRSVRLEDQEETIAIIRKRKAEAKQ